MPFVLDNSVVSDWLLDNQATAYTDAIARRLQDDRAVAPVLLRLDTPTSCAPLASAAA